MMDSGHPSALYHDMLPELGRVALQVTTRIRSAPRRSGSTKAFKNRVRNYVQRSNFLGCGLN